MTQAARGKPLMNFGRRNFLTTVGGTATGAVLAGSGLRKSRAARRGQQQSAPWKLDVTIYDRPGWTSTMYGLPLLKRGNGELVIGFQDQREDAMTDDFYSAHAEWVFLASTSGGKAWNPVSLDSLPLDPNWRDRSAHCTNGWPVRLADGSLVNVVEEVRTRQQQRERLDKLGLGHLWFEDSTFGWDLWPASHTSRLREQGLYVFDMPGPHIPEGIVATHNRPLVSTISKDGGRTWFERRISGLPNFVRRGGWFRGGVALEDGTVLGSMYGGIAIKGGDGLRYAAGAFALGTSDVGKTWQFAPIAHDPTGKQRFNETTMLVLPSGRILAMLRSDGPPWLYRSNSDDGGRTWAEPSPTAIPGCPANLLQLASGNILCVFRHVGYPNGYRGVLSRDGGASWDVDHQIIIRDDTMPGLVGYPSSAQLDDGTILTVYNVLRVGKLQPGDQWKYKQEVRVKPPLHSYIAGSLYTEDYVKPLGHS